MRGRSESPSPRSQPKLYMCHVYIYQPRASLHTCQQVSVAAAALESRENESENPSNLTKLDSEKDTEQRQGLKDQTPPVCKKRVGTLLVD